MYFKLLHLFPDLKDSDFILQDDGNGVFISKWNRAEPQPSQSEIDAITPAQEQSAKSNSPQEKSSQARERLKTRGVGVVTREEFNDLLDVIL